MNGDGGRKLLYHSLRVPSLSKLATVKRKFPFKINHWPIHHRTLLQLAKPLEYLNTHDKETQTLEWVSGADECKHFIF